MYNDFYMIIVKKVTRKTQLHVKIVHIFHHYILLVFGQQSDSDDSALDSEMVKHRLLLAKKAKEAAFTKLRLSFYQTVQLTDHMQPIFGIFLREKCHV